MTNTFSPPVTLITPNTSPLPPNNPEQHTSPNLTPPSQTLPSPAASSKQNSDGVLRPPSLDLKRPNLAEKVQQSPRGPAPTGRRMEPPGRHELTEEMATRQSPLASGSFKGREVTGSQPIAPRGPEKIELQTFEAPKSSLGVPPKESLKQQQSLTQKSLTTLGVPYPQVSYGPIQTPSTPRLPNNQRPEQYTTPKPAPPSQTAPPSALSSKQSPNAAIGHPSPPDLELSNPAGRMQQSPQGPVSIGQRTEKPSIDESAAKVPIGRTPPVSGFLENWELTASPSIALREPSTLVRPSEKIGSKTSQTPESSLDATSLSSNADEPIQLPAVPEDSKVDVTQGLFADSPTSKSRKAKKSGTVSQSLRIL